MTFPESTNDLRELIYNLADQLGAAKAELFRRQREAQAIANLAITGEVRRRASGDLPTKERLARDLEASGLTELAARARAGDYEEHSRPLAMVDLARDLFTVNAHMLARRAMAGEWQASPAEVEAWIKSQMT